MQKSLTTAIFVISSGLMLVGNARAQQTPPAKTSPSPAASAPTAPPSKKASAPAAKSATAPALTTQKEKAGYALGMNIGRSLSKQSLEVDSASLIRGIKDTLAAANCF